MTYDDFVNKIMGEVAHRPKRWRKGQAVFNVVDKFYGIARTVQLSYGIDCFYQDYKIDEFLEACWLELNKKKKKKST